VDLDKLVQGLVTELLADREGKPALTVAPLGVARVDHQLIRQVWQNLLSNALKFSAVKDAPRIEVGCQAIEGEDVYYVRDNGVGFNPAYAGELFGVFKRLHSAQGFSGTGVGLAICHRIVTSHGGRIWAEATEGEGATFYFTLKADRRREGEQRPGRMVQRA
jgi:light-regulated signal transduction histidine kinase (bacteriophytochrome)